MAFRLRNREWQRGPGELVVRVPATHLESIRRQGINVPINQSGYIFTNQGDIERIPNGIFRPVSAMISLVLFSRTFDLILEIDGYVIVLPLGVDENQFINLENNALDHYGVLTQNRLRSYLDPDLRTLVYDRFPSAKSRRQTASLLESEIELTLSYSLFRWGLKLTGPARVKLPGSLPHESDTCNPIGAPQDPRLAYLVRIGQNPEYHPLTHRRCYLGSSKHPDDLVSRLNRYNIYRLDDIQIVWVPAPAERQTKPIAMLECFKSQSGISHRLHFGWPGGAKAGLRININGLHIGNQPKNFHILQNFDRIEIEGNKPEKLLFIAPVSGRLTLDQIAQLEQLGLWGSAAYAWFLRGAYDRAQLALDCAIRMANPDPLQELLFRQKSELLRWQNKPEASIPIDIFYPGMNVPIAEIHALRVKVHAEKLIARQPATIYIFFKNTAESVQILDTRILFEIVDLSILKRTGLSVIGPQTWRRSRISFVPSRSGPYVADISVNFRQSDGTLVEQVMKHVFTILPRTPSVYVGGDTGAVKLDVDDPDFSPDIHVENDIGLVSIRIRKSE